MCNKSSVAEPVLFGRSRLKGTGSSSSYPIFFIYFYDPYIFMLLGGKNKCKTDFSVTVIYLMF